MSLRPHFQWLMILALRVKIPYISKFARAGPHTYRYAREQLLRYRKAVEEDPYNVTPSLFTKMLVAGDEDKLSFQEIVSDGGLYIFAGSDTTSNTLSYLVWAVTSDLAITDSLVKELEAVPQDFSHDDVRDLAYLNMVVDETLRLYPPISGPLPRVVPQGGAQLAGHRFPGGVTVSCQAYSMHRDPAIYPDPERFHPGRWAKPTKDMKDAFHSWGGGSRSKFSTDDDPLRLPSRIRYCRGRF